MKDLTLVEAHERYLEQAGWTLEVRTKILSKIKIMPTSRILDIGCGTGALAGEFPQANWYGLDIDHHAIYFAKSIEDNLKLVQADGANIPFPDRAFDLVYAHYFLLWQADPVGMIREMIRVTKPGGMIAFFAEPDHDGRIDSPVRNEKIGKLQTRSLREQGANTQAGRKLGQHLFEAGILDARFGVLGGEWTTENSVSDLERDILWSDLEQLEKGAPESMLVDGRGAFIFIPTFYGYGTRQV